MMTKGYRYGLALFLATACASESAKTGPGEQDTIGKLVECKQQLEHATASGGLCEKQLTQAKGQVEQCAKQLSELAATSATPPVMQAGMAGHPAAGGSGAPGAAGVSPPEAGEIKLKPEDQARLYETFVAQVKGSKNAIQQCYQSALKKNTAIQAKEIKLTVSVTVNQSGKVSNASFSPSLGSDFNICMSSVTSRWKVASFQGGSFTVESNVTLRPAD